MLQLRKLYLDCVGDDGSVCIAYASSLQALGLRIAPAGIERYDGQGVREVHRGRALLSLAREPDTAGLTGLRFALGARTCTIEIEPEQSAVATASAMPDGLTWCVKLARARVCIRDLRGPGDAIHGTGYSDWVELTQMPRALGLATLEWGRAHLEGGTLLYTRVERSGAGAWQTATLWPRAGAPQPISEFEFQVATGDGRRRVRFLRDCNGGGAFDLELLPERALHQGSALDRGRFPSWLERGVSRAFAGPTREQRWLSRARCSLLGTGVAVHESVRFGARALEPEA